MFPKTATRLTNKMIQNEADSDDTEPRWPAVIALLGGVGLFGVLPRYLSFGPRWLPAVVVTVLLVPTLLSHIRGHHTINRVLGLFIAGVETFFLVASLIKLIHSLLHPHIGGHTETPERLLISAGALWLTNVLVFALWYWHLDAGGPNQRDMRPGHCQGSFLFPQMTMSDERLAESGQLGWSPGFMDYLFLAFNTSTALSPADTAALSRWAKFLMMVQALISLTVIAVLAARAINTLS
ncbi:MAG: hypothetical protein ACRYFS_05210 [Janthinobacterium lividum]